MNGEGEKSENAKSCSGHSFMHVGEIPECPRFSVAEILVFKDPEWGIRGGGVNSIFSAGHSYL
jgi:hypothetical protein